MPKIKVTIPVDSLKLPDGIKREYDSGTEVLCPICGGLGLRRVGDFIEHCSNCYGGILKLCPYCKKVLGANVHFICHCEGWEESRKKNEQEKLQKAIDAAEKISIDEAIKRGIEMVYVEGWDKYWSIGDIGDEIEYLKDDLEEGEEPTVILFATTARLIHIDAYELAQSACEDLYEDAYDSLGEEDFKELQKALDEWCTAQLGTTTYEPNYKIVILLDELRKEKNGNTQSSETGEVSV